MQTKGRRGSSCGLCVVAPITSFVNCSRRYKRPLTDVSSCQMWNWAKRIATWSVDCQALSLSAGRGILGSFNEVFASLMGDGGDLEAGWPRCYSWTETLDADKINIVLNHKQPEGIVSVYHYYGIL